MDVPQSGKCSVVSGAFADPFTGASPFHDAGAGGWDEKEKNKQKQKRDVYRTADRDLYAGGRYFIPLPCS